MNTDDRRICEAYVHVHDELLNESKLSKVEAQYIDSGISLTERCDGCTMWRSPNKCAIVAGDIKPGAWCKWWKKNKST